jgi:hypothetical protein
MTKNSLQNSIETMLKSFGLSKDETTSKTSKTSSEGTKNRVDKKGLKFSSRLNARYTNSKNKVYVFELGNNGYWERIDVKMGFRQLSRILAFSNLHVFRNSHEFYQCLQFYYSHNVITLEEWNKLRYEISEYEFKNDIRPKMTYNLYSFDKDKKYKIETIEERAIRYCEKYGIISYFLKGSTMEYVEGFILEGSFKRVKVDLQTFKEIERIDITEKEYNKFKTQF